MKRLFFTSLIAIIVLAAMAAVGGVLLWQEVAGHPELSFSINGETIPIHEMDVADWIGAVFGIGLAMLIVLFVVPLSLILGLGLPLLIVGAALAGVGVLIAAPLLLPLLLLWWLLRRDRRTLRRASGKPQPPLAAGPGADA